MSEHKKLLSYPMGYAGTAVLVGVYFAFALWGTYAFGGRTAPTALIWPASGIGLALVLLRGAGVWLLIFAAACASSILALDVSSTRVLLTQAFVSGAASALEPLIAAWLIWRVVGEDFADHAGAFVLAMLMGVPVAAAAAGLPLALAEVTSAVLAERVDIGFLAAWYSATVADLMGILVLTPPIWIWAQRPEIEVRSWRRVEVLLFVGAVLVVLLMPEAAQARYLLVAIHLAIAMRFPLKWCAAAVALTSFAYLTLAALSLRVEPSPEVYAVFMGHVGFAIILNIATYVTALQQADIRNRASRLGELANHLGEAEERERQRIAQVLHDDLQQRLIAAKLTLDPRSDDKADRACTRIDEAIEIGRTLTAELHPPAFGDRPFSEALEWLGSHTEELTGLEIRVEADKNAEPGSPGMRAFMLQAVRELLVNVVKHAETDVAWVRLRQGSGELQVEVEDRGKGCDPAQFDEPASDKSLHGASTLRQRASLLGGRFDVSAEQGCKVTLTVPLLE